MRTLFLLCLIPACAVPLTPPDDRAAALRDEDPPLVGQYSAASLAWYEASGKGVLASGMGDLDGDGIDDLLLGDPSLGHPSWGSTGPGKVEILGGGSYFSELAEVQGIEDFEGVGNNVRAGDLDEDGIDDLIVSTPYATYLFYGPVSGTASLSDADATLLDIEGAAIGVADVSGDGHTDLVLGLVRTGRTYVFTEPLYRGAYAANAAIVIDGAVTTLDVGDVDGDGIDNLVISDDDEIRVYPSPLAAGTSTAYFLRHGGAYDDADGSRMAVVPDVTGDGRADVVLGAQQYGSDNRGRVIVWSGTTRYEIVGDRRAAYDNLGYSVGGIGDMDGDGYGDLLVGAFGSSQVWLVYGPLVSYQTTEALSNVSASFTGVWAVTGSGGDFNGDGVPDLWLGNTIQRAVYAIPGESRAPAGPRTVTDLQTGDLVISEWMANPSTCADSAGEWVELVNASAVEIDLDGLVLSDAAGTSGEVSGSLLLPPGGYVVLGTGTAEAWCSQTTAPDAFFGRAPTLNNSGDTLRIEDGTGRVLASVTYSSSLAASGVSAMRDADGSYVQSTAPLGLEYGTPGRPNDAMPEIDVVGIDALDPGDLIVTEIMANPAAVADDQGEWIEVFNASPWAVDLSGLEVVDAAGNTGVVAEGPVVEPGAYAVLGRGSAASWAYAFVADGFFGNQPALNNDGDRVALWAGDVELDRTAAWGSASSGVSLQWPGEPDAVANDDGAGWVRATASWGEDLGSPGSAN